MLVKNFVTTGGAERYAVELSTCLLRRGHEVHVYAQRWDPTLVDGMTIYRVPGIHRPRYLNALLYAFETRRLVKREAYDVIHSHQRTIFHQVLSMHHPCYSISRNRVGPISQFVGPFKRFANPRHFAYRWLESRQFGCASLRYVVAVSEGTKQDILARYDLASSVVRVIYPGVDSRKMSPEITRQHRIDVRKRYGLTEGDIAIIFVGSEFKRKGLRFAIEALGLLRDERVSCKVHFFVLGAGDQREYRHLAERFGIVEQVHFIGLYPHVEHYYAAADICLLPTLSDPFPLVVMEAMAFGLPVIVSKVQGVAEVLQNGYNAMLLDDPRDACQIKGAIIHLLEGSRRVELGSRAREAAQSFTWDRMTDGVIRLYEEISQVPGKSVVGC